MRIWKHLTHKEIKERVFNALGQNVNYYNANILGIPASHLDDKVFYQDLPFLSNAPFLSTLIHNPNHIGCHTLGKSESFFKGTQEIEKELVRICSEDILKGEANSFDGYVASGGTEANMQAIWVYRNYYVTEYNASLDEICIICSEDSHYSTSKAANVLHLDIAYAKVDTNNRTLDQENLEQLIQQQQKAGKKYFIVVANMMTTMFGSVDQIDLYIYVLEKHSCVYRIHVDGAFGGFFFPFSSEENKLAFSNSKVTSVTLDAHKMLQAPYGTGIFLIRKNYIGYANTKEASYVEGEDFTLIGSRSGANAIAVWMILMTYGPHGWHEKVLILLHRTDWLCSVLQKKGIEYYRQAGSNIVTIKSQHLTDELAKKYGLVPDNHKNPKWYKIVVMDHVTVEKLEPLVDEL